MIIKDKPTYTVTEFAKLMEVRYTTVVWWLKKGLVPGAYQQGDDDITIKRWRIPKEALTMQRPKRGRGQTGEGLVRTIAESRQIAELQDRCKRLEEELRKERLAVASQQLIIDKWMVERSSHALPKEDD